MFNFTLKYFKGLLSYRTVLCRLCGGIASTGWVVHKQIEQMLISSGLQFNIYFLTISLHCLKAVLCMSLQLNTIEQHP